MTRNQNLDVQRLIHGMGPRYRKTLMDAQDEMIREAIRRIEGCSDMLGRLRSLQAELDRRNRTLWEEK